MPSSRRWARSSCGSRPPPSSPWNRWGRALILGAWGGTAVAFVDNLLYPHLVGQRLRLHPLSVFVAVVGGLLLFGASGVILGPVVLAVTDALLDVWRRRTAGGRAAETGIAAA